jgi:hypothetical protein
VVVTTAKNAQTALDDDHLVVDDQNSRTHYTGIRLVPAKLE